MCKKKMLLLIITVITAFVIGVTPVSAATVVVDLLPESGWSTESTLIPVQIEGGWRLKTSPTMDGGNAVNYFDNTYHAGQMLAYDFTIEGEDSDATIVIGFIRDLDKSVYPKGEDYYAFSHYLAKAIGVQATGEEEATLPSGTYKGVLDVSDYFVEGFDKFQHVAFFVGGESMVVRQLAFVTGAQAVSEEAPSAKPTVSEPTTGEDKTQQGDNNQKPAEDSTKKPDDGTAQAPQPKQELSNGGQALVIASVSVAAVSLAAAVVMAVLLIKSKKKK